MPPTARAATAAAASLPHWSSAAPVVATVATTTSCSTCGWTFGRSDDADFLPLEGDLDDEVTRRLGQLGHESLTEWADIENLEERLDADGTRIDPVVLRVLRETTG